MMALIPTWSKIFFPLHTLRAYHLSSTNLHSLISRFPHLLTVLLWLFQGVAATLQSSLGATVHGHLSVGSGRVYCTPCPSLPRPDNFSFLFFVTPTPLKHSLQTTPPATTPCKLFLSYLLCIPSPLSEFSPASLPACLTFW